MSKYPVQYQSASKKKRFDVEDMPTPHILNAWRKLGATEPNDRTYETSQLLAAFESELVERGCLLDENGETWTLPPASVDARM